MNKKLFSITTLCMILSMPVAVIAAPFDPGVRPAPNLQANSATITEIIGKLFGLVWIFFIAFAIIMFIIAGFQFLSAQGEPEGVGKARKSIIWGVVGVAVGIIAFTLPFIIRGRVGL